jgi:hypothetical protein
MVSTCRDDLFYGRQGKPVSLDLPVKFTTERIAVGSDGSEVSVVAFVVVDSYVCESHEMDLLRVATP